MTQIASELPGKPKNATHKALSSLPDYAMPDVGGPGIEMPAAMREVADLTVSQVHDAVAGIKSVSEDASEAFEKIYTTLVESALEAGERTLETLTANANASLSLYTELIGAKSVADAVAVQTAFAGKQFDAFADQVRELQEFTQKLAADFSGPVQASWEKAFQRAKAD